ncbi:MAG: hypothetical protein A2046_06080 [Bacteroidetes bacterium GWA2_30_7]|nr:MAG: hypothetical protein A2046_06080 [Bacteroidetes bacterium GWA2_30_7]
MTKKILLLTFIAIISIANVSLSQKNEVGKQEIKYRRSSLHTILIEADNFPRKETVLKAYNNAPFPDKYNDHTIAIKSFDPKAYPVTNADREAAGQKLTKEKDGKEAEGNDAVDMPIIINKFLKDKKIASQLAAKWFNRQADGSFDMNLIGERGSYDATEMAANIAKGSARGVSSLADAGEELIKNTFVVFSSLNFVSNEIAAAITREAAKISANKIKIPAAQQAALKSADAAYEKAKEGYSVWTTAYLYRLKWNDSIAAVFYNDLWMDKSKIDPKKKEAFDNTDIFELELVGDENASSLVLFSLTEKRTEDQIVEIATIRNIDAVYAKLQKKYDVFKTKTPLFTSDPITAKIGMKEGLEGGESFDVLEQSIDPKTGLTKYESKGKISVDKDLIWDNRFNAGEEPALAEGEPKPVLDKTTFKGGKKFYPGMLIRQIK